MANSGVGGGTAAVGSLPAPLASLGETAKAALAGAGTLSPIPNSNYVVRAPVFTRPPVFVPPVDFQFPNLSLTVSTIAWQATAALAGAGILSATTSLALAAQATLAGSGTLSAAAAIIVPATATLPG